MSTDGARRKPGGGNWYLKPKYRIYLIISIGYFALPIVVLFGFAEVHSIIEDRAQEIIKLEILITRIVRYQPAQKKGIISWNS